MDECIDIRSPAAGSLNATPKTGGSRTERLLLRVPVLLAVALGLALGLTRFVLVLREDIRQSPPDWSAVLFLAAILAGVAVLIILASLAVGFLLGLVLQAGYGAYQARRTRSSAPTL
jgi:hypothetical protein